MFTCTYALHTAFYTCFSFQIHRYTWFTVIPLIFLMLHVIAWTCMSGPHHLIMYMCACYARHLALLYVLAGLRLTTLDSHVQILETGLGGLAVVEQSTQRILSWRSECRRSLDHRRSSSSQFLSCLALEASLTAREHLSAFVTYISSCIVFLYFLVM